MWACRIQRLVSTDSRASATTVSLTRLTQEFARTSSLECIQRAQLSTRYIDSTLVRARAVLSPVVSLSLFLLTPAAANAAARPTLTSSVQRDSISVTSGFRFCADNTKQLVPMTSNSRTTDSPILLLTIFSGTLVPIGLRRSLPSLELSVTTHEYTTTD